VEKVNWLKSLIGQKVQEDCCKVKVVEVKDEDENVNKNVVKNEK
jgi:hypothetical protein